MPDSIDPDWDPALHPLTDVHSQVLSEAITGRNYDSQLLGALAVYLALQSSEELSSMSVQGHLDAFEAARSEIYHGGDSQ